MWFKNKKTGFVWEILDKTTQEELLENPLFEKVNKDEKKEFYCAECDKEFKNLRAINAHNRMVHENEEDGDE